MSNVFRFARFIKPDVDFDTDLHERNYAPLFRKRFFLKDIRDARLFVCGLGYAYYYINGKAVSKDLFTSAVSHYDKTLWYHTYDVSELLLEGENTFAVICGNGWYNEDIPTVWQHNTASYRDLPKFILRLSVNQEDVLVSDATWKCLPESAIRFNALRSGEHFDANLYDENWNRIQFDDSTWKYATVDPHPPKGVFRPCLCEPIREDEVLPPQEITKPCHGTYLFDFGKNISGYVRLTVRGEPGQELIIRYGERKDEAGRVYHHGLKRFFPQSEFQTDRLICSGKPLTWSPKFTYHGFRYIEIEGIRNPDEVTVRGVFVHQSIERRTTFSSSEPILNRLFEAGIRSTYSNLFYQMTDCPTREKMGWTNDAHMSCEQLLTNFKSERFLEKWLTDVLDAMRENGALPGVIPTPGYGFDWGNGPLSDGILFEIPYRLYLHKGEPSALIASLPYFERYLDYLRTHEDEDGWISLFGLHDWATVGLATDNPKSLTNAVLQYKFYTVAALAAEKANNNALLEKYTHASHALKERILSAYLAPDGACTVSQMTSVALLIRFGLYRELSPLKKQLKALIEQNGFHHHCGMLGLRYLYEALEICGLQEYAYRIVTAQGCPGYAFWLEQDATTLWEFWTLQKGKEFNSRNHHLYSDVLSWMIKTVLGIRHDKTDAQTPEIRIEPFFFEGLSYAEGSYGTETGCVRVHWQREDGGVSLVIGITGKLCATYRGNRLTAGMHHFHIS